MAIQVLLLPSSSMFSTRTATVRLNSKSFFKRCRSLPAGGSRTSSNGHSDCTIWTTTAQSHATRCSRLSKPRLINFNLRLIKDR
ncbi:unnamed protein product [Oikopleura dioica]|uniref:Uncharacterized protein n=1 Tax=Oikopleura dioica TaxID=34765 RepID=E4WTC2_OIKDI|nr:unnamed protein product [Oikopleura dioica]